MPVYVAKVLPSTQYEIVPPTGRRVAACEYASLEDVTDANNRLQNWTTSSETAPVSTAIKKTTTANTHYIVMGFSAWQASDITVGTNAEFSLHFVWDGERDGECEPYEAHTYALDAKTAENPSGDLRGLFKIVNGELVADGDEYTSDGKVARKYGIVDLGTLTWNKTASTSVEGTYFFSTSITTGTTRQRGLIAPYSFIGTASGSLTSDKTWANSTTNIGRIYIRDDSFASSDASAFKTAMNGVYFVYELDTPTEEEATPYTEIQVSDEWGTMQYVDERAVPIPVGHDTDALANVAENIPMPPTANGTYVLKATMADGMASYAWVAE